MPSTHYCLASNYTAPKQEMIFLIRPCKIQGVAISPDGGSTYVGLEGAKGQVLHVLFDYKIGSQTRGQLFTIKDEQYNLVDLGSAQEDQLLEMLKEGISVHENPEVVGLVRNRIEKLKELRSKQAT